jgi:hypothetical protein
MPAWFMQEDQTITQYIPVQPHTPSALQDAMAQNTAIPYNFRNPDNNAPMPSPHNRHYTSMHPSKRLLEPHFTTDSVDERLGSRGFSSGLLGGSGFGGRQLSSGSRDAAGIAGTSSLFAASNSGQNQFSFSNTGMHPSGLAIILIVLGVSLPFILTTAVFCVMSVLIKSKGRHMDGRVGERDDGETGATKDHVQSGGSCGKDCDGSTTHLL